MRLRSSQFVRLHSCHLLSNPPVLACIASAMRAHARANGATRSRANNPQSSDTRFFLVSINSGTVLPESATMQSIQHTAFHWHPVVRRSRTTLKRVVSGMAAMREEAPAQCKELLLAGHQYLDVRSEQEFESGHTDGAKNIPFMFKTDGGMVPNQDFLSQVKAAYPDKGVELVVGCQSGRRSGMAIQAMQGDGYQNLVNLAGGFTLWSAEGL